MRLEYSPALQTAFERAGHIARQAGAMSVGPRHLLTGMLVEDEGKAASLLTQARIDWPRLQAHLGLPVDLTAAEPGEHALHSSFQVIMTQARDLAIKHGEEGTISTDHVLLAMLTVNASLREELESFGLDFEHLRGCIVGTPTPLTIEVPILFKPMAEEVDAGRILDASANRAREALRVLEDHARFTWNDRFLSGELKQLRHDLTEALGLLPAGLLLAARDTIGDVGTTLSTEAEWERPGIMSVIAANAKRLQEALRSLEEFGKVLNVEFAQRIEKLRYQSYTLERALVVGQNARDRLRDAQLYVLVTQSLCKASLVGTVKEAILGGAQVIQLREKEMDDAALLAVARDLRQMTRAHGVLLIINDRPDIARLSEADGVHLGQEDLAIHDARRIVGPDMLVGVSTHGLEQLRKAILQGADYVGVGPTFPSATKSFDAFAGLAFVREAFVETTLPAFAIGGIHLGNIAEVVAAGARRVAVSHAICAADDPRQAAARLRAALC